MGPDEYHFNINNSVYTNYNAKLSLMLPQYIKDYMGMWVIYHILSNKGTVYNTPCLPRPPMCYNAKLSLMLPQYIKDYIGV